METIFQCSLLLSILLGWQNAHKLPSVEKSQKDINHSKTLIISLFPPPVFPPPVFPPPHTPHLTIYTSHLPHFIPSPQIYVLSTPPPPPPPHRWWKPCHTPDTIPLVSVTPDIVVSITPFRSVPNNVLILASRDKLVRPFCSRALAMGKNNYCWCGALSGIPAPQKHTMYSAHRIVVPVILR